jgi:hypothetical protein
VIHGELARQLARETPDFDVLDRLLAAAREGDVHLDLPDLHRRVRQLVERLAAAVEIDDRGERLEELSRAIDFALALFSSIDLSRAQNLVWALWSSRQKGPLGPALAALGDKLNLELPGAHDAAEGHRPKTVSR